ncbi:MAG TPA: hypothetical protein VJC16_02205 [Candidatus Nanoarchaeia archaeon]|nr:hypothetical protein [Candidatus Nanoarchaeia archaeon]
MSSLLVELPPIKEGRIFHKIKKRCICGKVYIAKSISRKYCYACSPPD